MLHGIITIGEAHYPLTVRRLVVDWAASIADPSWIEQRLLPRPWTLFRQLFSEVTLARLVVVLLKEERLPALLAHVPEMDLTRPFGRAALSSRLEWALGSRRPTRAELVVCLRPLEPRWGAGRITTRVHGRGA